MPGPGEDVTIREGVIQVNSNVTIRYLRLDPAVTFTVMPGYTITVTN